MDELQDEVSFLVDDIPHILPLQDAVPVAGAGIVYIRLIPSEREYTTETGRKEEQMQRKDNAGHCHFDHAGSEAGREFTLGFLYPRTGSRGKVSLEKSFPRRGRAGQPSHSKNVSINNFLSRIVSAV